MIAAQSLLWLMNQSGDALCYVSPGLWPPPLPPQSASPDWFDAVLAWLAGEIQGWRGL